MSESPMVPPTNQARLTWTGAHRFEASTAHGTAVIESGEGRQALSPMEAMLAALAGCMAIDVVDILVKMKKPVAAYAIDCQAWRREEAPRRFTRVRLTHRVSGPDVDELSVTRAVSLSQEKYCSAMASLHPAIVVENRIELTLTSIA
jgi:putative redox protein